MAYLDYALIEKSTLGDIGDAIREKTNSVKLLDPSKFASEIKRIPSEADKVPLQDKTIKINGEYTADEYYYGFNTVTVDVDSGIDGLSVVVNSTKLIDMALNKANVVVNNDILQNVYNNLLNELQSNITAYDEYCTTNSLKKNNDSITSYLSSDGYAATAVSTWAWDNAIFCELANKSKLHTLTDDDLVGIIIGGNLATRDKTYTINDSDVEVIRSVFDAYISSANLGYYWVDVLPMNELPASWFANTQAYENALSYIASSDNITYFTMLYKRFWNPTYLVWGNYELSMLDNSKNYLIVRSSTNINQVSGTSWYNEDFTTASIKACKATYNNGLVANWSVYDQESFNSYGSLSTFSPMGTSINKTVGSIDNNGVGYQGLYLFSKTGGKKCLFTSVDNMKKLSVGNQPYYFVSSREYLTDNDNTINFTGDYYVANKENYSYDIIQNRMNNATTINDNIRSNIINEQVSVIESKYLYVGDENYTLQSKKVNEVGEVIADGEYYGLSKVTIDLPLQEKTAEQGDIVEPDDGYYGLSKVTVTPVLLQEKMTFRSGEITADGEYFGLSKVIVDVPAGGNIDNGYSVNFYNHDKILIETRGAKCGNSIIPPYSYEADAWEDESGYSYSFPYTVPIADTGKVYNMFAAGLKTVEQELYSFYEIDKQEYPHLLLMSNGILESGAGWDIIAFAKSYGIGKVGSRNYLQVNGLYKNFGMYCVVNSTNLNDFVKYVRANVTSESFINGTSYLKIGMSWEVSGYSNSDSMINYFDTFINTSSSSTPEYTGRILSLEGIKFVP